MVRLEEGWNSNGHKVSKILWMYFIFFKKKNQCFPTDSFADTSKDLKYLTNWRNVKNAKI